MTCRVAPGSLRLHWNEHAATASRAAVLLTVPPLACFGVYREGLSAQAPLWALVAVALSAATWRGALGARPLRGFAFLLCLFAASRVVLPATPLPFGVRPAVVLVALGGALAAWTAPRVRPRPCTGFGAATLAGGTVVAAAAVVGWMVLSRQYALEWPVLQRVVLHSLLLPLGWFLGHDAAETPRGARWLDAWLSLALAVGAGLAVVGHGS